jgi:hypothetical protein
MSNPWTDEQELYLQEYLHGALDVLNLLDWTILFYNEVPSTDGTAASICPSQKRKYAVVRIDPQFSQSPLEMRSLLAHELAHLHLEQAWEYVRVVLESSCGQESYDSYIEEPLNMHFEYSVDAIGQAFEELLPLPEVPGF